MVLGNTSKDVVTVILCSAMTPLLRGLAILTIVVVLCVLMTNAKTTTPNGDSSAATQHLARAHTCIKHGDIPCAVNEAGKAEVLAIPNSTQHKEAKKILASHKTSVPTSNVRSVVDEAYRSFTGK